MSTRRLSQPDELLRAWSTQAVPMEDPERILARGDVVVDAIARSIRTGVERRDAARRARRVGVLALAAALLLAAGGVLQWRHGASQQPGPLAVVSALSGPVVVTEGGDTRIVAAASKRALRGGDEIETAANARAEIRTQKSVVRVSSGTKLWMPVPMNLEERYRVAFGRVGLSVDKDARSARSVVVETPNAEVVVRGTVFAVDVAPRAAHSVTEVSVTRGSVWVLVAGVQVASLGPGQRWSSDPSPPVSAPEEKSDAPSAVGLGSASGVQSFSHGLPRRSAKAVPDPKTGTLAEENRLFEEALDARNRGDAPRTTELFGKLMTRFPHPALAEEARVERFRAFKQSGKLARAVAEARRYLAEYPQGFAREEARSLALDSDLSGSGH